MIRKSSVVVNWMAVSSSSTNRSFCSFTAQDFRVRVPSLRLVLRVFRAGAFGIQRPRLGT
jgi:hypothetical protein